MELFNHSPHTSSWCAGRQLYTHLCGLVQLHVGTVSRKNNYIFINGSWVVTRWQYTFTHKNT